MKTKAVTLLGLFVFLLWAFPGNPASLTGPPVPPVIDLALAETLRDQGPGQPVRVIVTLSGQSGSFQSERPAAGKRQALVQALQRQAGLSQQSLRGYLTILQERGSVRTFQPLWIVNAIAVTADAQTIQALAAFPGVKNITPDAVIPGPAPADQTTPGVSEQNVTLINAPLLWSLGYSGQGVVVASLDTGVDYTHPDLIAEWRGGSNSWYDPYGQHPSIPTDLNGHGTRTMGIMVGQGNSGRILGVAPQAKWIAVKIFDDNNRAQTSAIHQAYQWLLDPDGNPATDDAPDIANNSWDFEGPGCDLTFEPDLQALVAAGITPVFAAGNYGPTGATSASPGNNPEAIAVGDTDHNDQIDPLSSRGFNSCGRVSVSIYPDLVAPGMTINTTDLNHKYTAVTGTSFSAPSVSGALALLLSAFPHINVSQQKAALAVSAKDLGFSGPDNTYGYGRIDVFAAYRAIADAAMPTPTQTPTATPTATPTPVEQIMSSAPRIYFPVIVK